MQYLAEQGLKMTYGDRKQRKTMQYKDLGSFATSFFFFFFALLHFSFSFSWVGSNGLRGDSYCGITGGESGVPGGRHSAHRPV